MKVTRLYGPNLPLMAWLSYLTMHAAPVSIVAERELQDLEKENAVLEERLASANEIRTFWHEEYKRMAEAVTGINRPASSRGSSSPN